VWVSFLDFCSHEKARRKRGARGIKKPEPGVDLGFFGYLAGYARICARMYGKMPAAR
jgi:hypothetical protein